jgi:hypothetical protein
MSLNFQKKNDVDAMCGPKFYFKNTLLGLVTKKSNNQLTLVKTNNA